MALRMPALQRVYCMRARQQHLLTDQPQAGVLPCRACTTSTTACTTGSTGAAAAGSCCKQVCYGWLPQRGEAGALLQELEAQQALVSQSALGLWGK